MLYQSTCWLMIFSLHSTRALRVSGVSVHRVKLRLNDEDAPYCLGVSSSMDIINNNFHVPINFLATQVWPSARLAALALETYMPPQWTVCEFGCGPGLPSLTAAKRGAARVYATDLDEFSLQLVDEASKEQDLQDIVQTQRVDLTAHPSRSNIPKADLYVLSDVFESSAVARGAAKTTQYILQNYRNSNIWIFAQSDRACREDFLDAMRKKLQDPSLKWTPLAQYDPTAANRLFLCDLDETTVPYV